MKLINLKENITEKAISFQKHLTIIEILNEFNWF